MTVTIILLFLKDRALSDPFKVIGSENELVP